jgi:hypothetical protein
MSVLGAISRQDKGTGAVLPNLQTPPESTGFFQNVGAGFTQSVAGPHSTRNARAIYESRQYDQIIAALAAEGEQATDMVDIGVKSDSPFYRQVPGAQVQPDGRVLVPVKRPFANPFSEGPSLTRDVNPLSNFYLGGDAAEEKQIWDAVNRVRAKGKKDFLSQFPDQTAVDAVAQQQRQADEATAGDVTSRATTLGKLGGFIGNVAGSIASGDPENLVGGWSGAAGKSFARTVVKRAVEGAAANTIAGIAAVPGQATDAESLGQHMTAGDVARSVAENATAGALIGTAHVVVPKIGGAAVDAAVDAAGKAFDAAAPHLPDAVRDPVVAASIRAGTVKDRQLLYEFQRAHNPYSAVDTSTPTEKAAAHVLTQDIETKEQSPLQPAAEGAHADRLTAVAKALGVDLTPPETPTTAPIQTPTVRDRSQGATSPTRPASFVEGINAAEGSTRNPRSSADGYGNFIDSTWLSVAPHVTDTSGMSRQQILDLRHNKDIAGDATQYYAAQNASYLRARGLEDSPGNLSLAHFLGPEGAATLLKADPRTPVESLLPAKVIEANHEVLRGKSADEVIAWAHKRIGAAVDHPPARPDAVSDEGFDPTSPVPYTVEELRPDELPPTSAEAPTDEPWDPIASQHLLVWENNDGERSLIDGGKRLAHARSLDDQTGITLPTIVLRERDGVSEEMAMLVGKLKNINLGTTSLEDAAGTLADIPEIADALRSPQFKQEIAALAQLPYEKFGQVVNGTLDPVEAAYQGSPNALQLEALRPSRGGELGAGVYFSRDRSTAAGYAIPKGEDAISPHMGVLDLDLRGLRIKEIKREEWLAERGQIMDELRAANGGEWKGEFFDEAMRRLEGRFKAEGYHGIYDDNGQGVIFPEFADKIRIAQRTPHKFYSERVNEAAKEPALAGTRDSGGAGEPPRREGRDLAAEAPDENLPRGGQPSLFDRAVTARDAAEKFSEPAGPEAQKQTAMLEHDLRHDAGMPVERPQSAEEGKQQSDTGKGAKGAENASGEASVHLFDLPETGFRLSEEGNTVTIKEALDQADADEAAAKALRDCL